MRKLLAAVSSCNFWDRWHYAVKVFFIKFGKNRDDTKNAWNEVCHACSKMFVIYKFVNECQVTFCFVVCSILMSDEVAYIYLAW